MNQNKPKHELGGAMKYIKPVLVGTAVGAAVTALVLTALSLLLSLQDIPQMLITPMVLVALGLGAFTGGWVTAALVHEKGLFLGLCCGVLLFAAIFICGQAVNKSEIGAAAAIKLVAALTAGAFGGVFGVNYKKRRK